MTDQRSTPLTVSADLTVSIDDTAATVTSTGERLFVEFPSMTGALRALRRSSPVARRTLHGELTSADLALEIRVRHRTVAALGATTRAGLVSQSLGVDPLEVRLGGLLSALGATLGAGIDRVRDFVD